MNPVFLCEGQWGRSFENLAEGTIGTFNSQIPGKRMRMTSLKHFAPSSEGPLTELKKLYPFLSRPPLL